jgi:hypothetical protein
MAVAAGNIGFLGCNAPIHVGSIKANKQIALGTVTTSFNYSGGNNGESVAMLQVPSTGVTGLSAGLVIEPGNIGSSGIFVFNIAGKATTSGVATFTFTLYGQTCSFTRAVEPDTAGCNDCLPSPEPCPQDESEPGEGNPNGCLEFVPDTCLKYTGIDYPCLGITTGMNLKLVLQKLILAAAPCPKTNYE